MSSEVFQSQEIDFQLRVKLVVAEEERMTSEHTGAQVFMCHVGCWARHIGLSPLSSPQACLRAYLS
jgi:hypothetical protein